MNISQDAMDVSELIHSGLMQQTHPAIHACYKGWQAVIVLRAIAAWFQAVAGLEGHGLMRHEARVLYHFPACPDLKAMGQFEIWRAAALKPGEVARQG